MIRAAPWEVLGTSAAAGRSARGRSRGCVRTPKPPQRKLQRWRLAHAGAYVSLNPHLGWQAAESYVERSNIFALIPGHRVLADCPVAALACSVMNLRCFNHLVGAGKQRGRNFKADRAGG